MILSSWIKDRPEKVKRRGEYMAKASRCYTGSRKSVGTPTLKRNDYMMLIKQIRKAKEKKDAESKIR